MGGKKDKPSNQSVEPIWQGAQRALEHARAADRIYRRQGSAPNVTTRERKGRGIQTPTHRQKVARWPAPDYSPPLLAQMDSKHRKGRVKRRRTPGVRV